MTLKERNDVIQTPYNVLSLDGGGVRGVVEAVLLRRITDRFPNFLRDTDFFVGTSTGGIIALGLADGKSPSDLIELYEDKSKFIFQDSLVDDVKDIGKLRGAEYDNDNLKTALQAEFGDKKLGDLERKVAITAFDLNRYPEDPAHTFWKLKVFHNFDTFGADNGEKIVDVALRTSAAPVYFPTYGKFIDGGVVANNPALVGLAQALTRQGAKKNLSDIYLLSIGSGKVPRYIEGEDLDWGYRQWLPYIFDLTFYGGMDTVDFICNELLSVGFHRLCPLLDKDYKLGDWKLIPELIEIAENVYIDETIDWLKKNWR